MTEECEWLIRIDEGVKHGWICKGVMPRDYDFCKKNTCKIKEWTKERL